MHLFFWTKRFFRTTTTRSIKNTFDANTILFVWKQRHGDRTFSGFLALLLSGVFSGLLFTRDLNNGDKKIKPIFMPCVYSSRRTKHHPWGGDRAGRVGWRTSVASGLKRVVVAATAAVAGELCVCACARNDRRRWRRPWPSVLYRPVLCSTKTVGAGPW